MTQQTVVVTEPENRYRAEHDAKTLVDAQVVRMDGARLKDAMLVLPETLKAKASMLDQYREDVEAAEFLLMQ